jgi:hypothetical protein
LITAVSLLAVSKKLGDNSAKKEEVLPKTEDANGISAQSAHLFFPRVLHRTCVSGTTFGGSDFPETYWFLRYLTTLSLPQPNFMSNGWMIV